MYWLLDYILCIIFVMVGVHNFIVEYKGQDNLAYSKFSENAKGAEAKQKFGKVPSKVGMLVLYTIPMLSNILFYFKSSGDPYGMMMHVMLGLTFAKRVIEVLFVHIYSGTMALPIVAIISSAYTSASVVGYAAGVTEPVSTTRLILCWVLFIVGSVGNGYHHYLLRLLRTRGSDQKTHQIPSGGLFEYVVCPHYLFELIAWAGIGFLSMKPSVLGFLFSIAMMLCGRSNSTLNWYKLKFGDQFPRRNRIIPGVY